MSIEKAKAKLEDARRGDPHNRIPTPMALRVEAVVLAIEALIERLDAPPACLCGAREGERCKGPSETAKACSRIDACEHCGVRFTYGHTYHRSDCPDWRP